jgi:hypothetical protein
VDTEPSDPVEQMEPNPFTEPVVVAETAPEVVEEEDA